jgi:hypothetical protein
LIDFNGMEICTMRYFSNLAILLAIGLMTLGCPSNTGRLHGYVRELGALDSVNSGQGAPIPGATIEFIGLEDTTIATTDSSGYFSTRPLNPGSYTAVISAPGHEPMTREGFAEVWAGADNGANFWLSRSQSEEGMIEIPDGDEVNSLYSSENQGYSLHVSPEFPRPGDSVKVTVDFEDQESSYTARGDYEIGVCYSWLQGPDMEISIEGTDGFYEILTGAYDVEVNSTSWVTSEEHHIPEPFSHTTVIYTNHCVLQSVWFWVPACDQYPVTDIVTVRIDDGPLEDANYPVYLCTSFTFDRYQVKTQ